MFTWIGHTVLRIMRLPPPHVLYIFIPYDKYTRFDILYCTVLYSADFLIFCLKHDNKIITSLLLEPFFCKRFR